MFKNLGASVHGRNNRRRARFLILPLIMIIMSKVFLKYSNFIFKEERKNLLLVEQIGYIFNEVVLRFLVLACVNATTKPYFDLIIFAIDLKFYDSSTTEIKNSMAVTKFKKGSQKLIFDQGKNIIANQIL
jgi:hypothetical protein